MSDPADTPYRDAKWRIFSSGYGPGCVLLGIALILFLGPALAPRPGGIQRAPESSAMQAARSINLLMFSYANDNDQQYPVGKSSTEIFQKLLDGKYASDNSVFYLPLPGKIKPKPGEKLKPENVGFDVTVSIDSSSPDQLPVVFMTGYKVTYAPGSSAVFREGPKLPKAAHGANGGTINSLRSLSTQKTASRWLTKVTAQRSLKPMVESRSRISFHQVFNQMGERTGN